MEFKLFLKPTTSKIITTIIIGIIAIVYNLFQTVVDIGYPFIFYDENFSLGMLGAKHDPIFKIHYLLLDVLIWYLVGCVLVYAITTISKRRKKSN